jgi:hypothetical protein
MILVAGTAAAKMALYVQKLPNARIGKATILSKIKNFCIFDHQYDCEPREQLGTEDAHQALVQRSTTADMEEGRLVEGDE